MRSSRTDAGPVGHLAEQAHDAQVALAAAGQGAVDDLLEHQPAGPGGGGPCESKAPALISDSTERLLSTMGSTRWQKS